MVALSSSGGPRVRFFTRYDGEVSEPLVGRQGSRVSMRVPRGSASLLRCSCLENSMDRGALKAGYSPWGGKELDMTEVT